MVAIQDALDETGTILLYVFDAVVILYFIAFPLTTVIYHPHVHCFQSNLSQEAAPPPAAAPPPSGQPHGTNPAVPPLEPIEYLESPRRPSPISTSV
ncbi:unnamed protein product [Strongylus vulgaris]|uniref:Uncharacterized protein n=1 Tax=Strongylus vulgaris TaxID=40348 RepID=A0A3P7JK56_STRVU|nr:unnamed protein product [Strongylus vulgaris]